MAKPSKKLASAEPDPDELRSRVRELVESVSGFAFLTPSHRRKINSAATLPDRFYLIGALLMDDNEWLSTTAHLTGEEIRRMLDFSGAHLNVARDLELLAKGLRATVAERRGDVGKRLLLAYAIAKEFNRSNARSVEIPHVQKMQELLRLRRRGGAKRKTEGESDGASEER